MPNVCDTGCAASNPGGTRRLVALPASLPEPRQVHGRAQPEETVLLSPCDLERRHEARLRFLRSAAAVEERARVDAVDLGVGPACVLTLSPHQTESHDAEGVAVAADPPEPLREHHQETGRPDPDGDLRQLGEGVLHLGDASLEVARVGACPPPRKETCPLLRTGEAERCGELHELISERQRSLGLAALEVVNRDVQQHACQLRPLASPRCQRACAGVRRLAVGTGEAAGRTERRGDGHLQPELQVVSLAIVGERGEQHERAAPVRDRLLVRRPRSTLGARSG